ncbi:uncharacterized protein LOC141905544 isoform X2 [Tubulanus polymorphus]|uniref:uncharacterized protein LOC141905544 isoform X2 n=1 Tax=Tubulanus polymorphus TaxID=672921 RepID=UPI003DA6B53E
MRDPLQFGLPRLGLYLFVGLFLYQLAAGAKKPLQCYECENEHSNFMCMSDFNIVECARGFDTCQTLISYSERSEKLSISKICTKNQSCHAQINATRARMPCDLTKNSWVCTTCCHTDKCNLNGAHVTVPMHWAMISAILIMLTSLCSSDEFM